MGIMLKRLHESNLVGHEPSEFGLPFAEFVNLDGRSHTRDAAGTLVNGRKVSCCNSGPHFVRLLESDVVWQAFQYV